MLLLQKERASPPKEVLYINNYTIIQQHVTENKNYRRPDFLPFHYTVVPRFYGDDTPLVRVDGQGTVPARRLVAQCRYCSTAHSIDTDIRPCILLGYLPLGRISGHRCTLRQVAAQEPLHLLTGQKLASLRNARSFCDCPCCRHRLFGSPSRAIQRIRPHRQQSLCPAIPMGQ